MIRAHQEVRELVRGEGERSGARSSIGEYLKDPEGSFTLDGVGWDLEVSFFLEGMEGFENNFGSMEIPFWKFIMVELF